MDKGFNLQLSTRPPTAKPKDACADGALGHLVRMEASYKRKLKNKNTTGKFPGMNLSIFSKEFKAKKNSNQQK